ncbi:hypothetical protein C922_05297 [Plasmodium inui San Antonio 1]|uniref:Uncharacterized protein n=1 Tax=Plasmodium inui San Antonio 1 TaxID=1237626 RepID=W6ZYB2_9APIC|nr:hypothetical protein C922_05297 [Plasmodium inui San Antonio 1]EUD64323.1 hypothetical protein C922_05297 [Plasmodium inui San Antonio 1]
MDFQTYLEEKLLARSAEGRCKLQKNGQRDFCIFEGPQNRAQGREITAWKRGAIDRSKWQTRENLWRYSKEICIGLEAWWAALEQKDINGEVFYKSACKPNQAKGVALGRLDPGSCQIEIKKLKWNSLQHQVQLNTWQKNHRYLGICMDIVSMILEHFQMYSSGTRDSNVLKRQNPCNALYKSLEEWGGAEVAQGVLEGWYTDNNQKQKSSIGFLMTGTDLYEVISDLFYDDDKGDRGVSCEFSRASGLENNQEQGEYELRLSTGLNLGKCDQQGSLCGVIGQNPHNGDRNLPGRTGYFQEPTAGNQNNSSQQKPAQVSTERISQAGPDNITEYLRNQDPTGSTVATNSTMETYGPSPWGKMVGGVASILGGIGSAYGIYRIFRKRRVTRSTSSKQPGIISRIKYQSS